MAGPVRYKKQFRSMFPVPLSEVWPAGEAANGTARQGGSGLSGPDGAFKSHQQVIANGLHQRGAPELAFRIAL